AARRLPPRPRRPGVVDDGPGVALARCAGERAAAVRAPPRQRGGDEHPRLGGRHELEVALRRQVTDQRAREGATDTDETGEAMSAGGGSRTPTPEGRRF